jgi:hypothetical protein
MIHRFLALFQRGRRYRDISLLPCGSFCEPKRLILAPEAAMKTKPVWASFALLLSVPPMRPLRQPSRFKAWRLLSIALGLHVCAHAEDETRGYIWVSSHAWEGYVRAKLPDGSFRPETYALGKGGKWDIAMKDDTIDKLSFEDIARTISAPLAEQNYLRAVDSDNTELLIMVYWGTTTGRIPAAGRQHTLQEKNMVKNELMLGFDSPLKDPPDPFKFDYQDLVGEVRRNRYFVVLLAYDFQMMSKLKKHRLLWETRYSIRQAGNDFAAQLSKITEYASPFFGRPSNGMQVQPIPQGQVKVGEPSSLGSVPQQ